MQITDEMVQAAVKKAVEQGLIPKHCDTETYLKNYNAIKAVLQSALDAA